jgi:hypothetical protein
VEEAERLQLGLVAHQLQELETLNNPVVLEGMLTPILVLGVVALLDTLERAERVVSMLQLLQPELAVVVGVVDLEQPLQEVVVGVVELEY